MKCLRMLSLLLCFACIDVNTVFSHSGRTDSNGGHTCRTNCAENGFSTGQYHVHDDPYIKSLDKDIQQSLKDMEIQSEKFYSTYNFPTPPNSTEVKKSVPVISQDKVNRAKTANIDFQKAYNDNMNRIKELQKQNRISPEASQYYIDTFKREKEARRERLLEMERHVTERREEPEELATDYEEESYNSAYEETGFADENTIEESDSQEEQSLAILEDNETSEEALSPEAIVSIIIFNLAWIICLVMYLNKRRISK
uniref:YHYH domain-containing protein n=1 Tax=Bacillus sp. DX2.2 TaxID=3073452 RepID=UPI00402ACBA0